MQRQRKYTIHSLVIVEMKRRSNNMATHTNRCMSMNTSMFQNYILPLYLLKYRIYQWLVEAKCLER
uniref:Uncharacterized protein n=1 Tax=Anguilla anguilla TaxID=7936 RepID=A0A0E9VYY0_ANGAN